MSELESILNYLETTSMEPHDDYTSEFSYKEQKVLRKYIKQLQQENKKYKEVKDKAIELLGNYKHYSTPDEEQNSDNENLVNKAFDLLKEVE